MTIITIDNIARETKLGYAICTTPKYKGIEIALPSRPDFTGTIEQIKQQIAEDFRYLNSIQVIYESSLVFFYDGIPIEFVWSFGRLRECAANCASYNDESFEINDSDCDCYPWGEGWFSPDFYDFWDHRNNKPKTCSLKIKLREEPVREQTEIEYLIMP